MFNQMNFRQQLSKLSWEVGGGAGAGDRAVVRVGGRGSGSQPFSDQLAQNPTVKHTRLKLLLRNLSCSYFKMIIWVHWTCEKQARDGG